MIKRAVDICLAGIGCIVLLPVFFPLALLIKLSSKGPVLYLCDRVGKDGTLFKMYKFRSMYDIPDQSGPSVCPQGDPRVTSIGRFLRRSKINELPQLLNVLWGDMSFVGPRPEAPDLAASYPPEAKVIFSVKPGLVGPNQILGRNEEELYPPGVDPQTYYIEEILPKKLPVDLAYVRQASAFKDLKYIVLGVKETIFKALSWNLFLQNQSQICLLLADLGLIIVSFTLAYYLKFGDSLGSFAPRTLLPLLLAVVLVRLLCCVYFGLYGTLIRYLSFHDLVSVFKGVTAGSILLISLPFFLTLPQTLSPTIFLIDWLCLVFLMASLRGALRLYRDRHGQNQLDSKRRVLIFGAGDAGVLAYQSLLSEKNKAYDVVGFLDDDPAKRHKALYGKKVLGNRFMIEALVKLYQVHEILLAMPSAPLHERMNVIQACQKAEVPFQTFPTLRDNTLPVAVAKSQVPLAELLKTPDIHMDEAAVQQLLTANRILVTGTCGALGVELCRQILRFSPQQLVIIDRYESYLAELVAGILNSDNANQVFPVLCPAGSNGKIADVFQKYRPHIVFHTTARKYQPVFPIHMDTVVQANYASTFRLARQAANCGSAYFVMLSSLEAGTRGNLLSDSLRATEISLRQFFATQPTRLVIVRLCDILENRGGVVTAIEDKIAYRQPITLSYPEAKHWLLSKRAAAHFILQSLALRASGMAEEGIFVCNHIAPVSLLEIASKLAQRDGLQLEYDVPIRFLNAPLSNGVSSALQSDTKSLQMLKTGHADISLLPEKPLDSPQIVAAIQHLLGLQEHGLEPSAWERPTHAVLDQYSVT